MLVFPHLLCSGLLNELLLRPYNPAEHCGGGPRRKRCVLALWGLTEQTHLKRQRVSKMAFGEMPDVGAAFSGCHSDQSFLSRVFRG